MRFVLITLLPSAFFAVIARGLYMFHYRYVDDSIESYHAAASQAPLLCSPARLGRLTSAFFTRSARTSDTGKVYLIRIYITLFVVAAVRSPPFI